MSIEKLNVRMSKETTISCRAYRINQFLLKGGRALERPTRFEFWESFKPTFENRRLAKTFNYYYN